MERLQGLVWGSIVVTASVAALAAPGFEWLALAGLAVATAGYERISAALHRMWARLAG